MKIKRSNKKILPLFASVILILSIIIGIFAPTTNADSPKIIVNDNDGDGTISTGDDFCLGTECFYVIDNSNGNIRALTKYNINAGGDTYNVQNDPDYQNLSYIDAMTLQYSNGYYECNWIQTWANSSVTYSATRCYKKYDIDVVYIDVSNREDIIGTNLETLYNKVEAEYGKDVYDCEYDYIYEGQTSTFIPYFCYDFVTNDIDIHQDPEMLSAHSGPDGKLVFPMRGNIYVTDSFYDSNNNLVLTEDYRDLYQQGINQDTDYYYYMTNTSISNYIYKYAEELSENYNIEGINLLTYNDLMHVLNDINPYNAYFADDNYLIEDDETFVWEEQIFDEDDPHGYSYWFTSILDYVPEQYDWIYSTSYWLATSWIYSHGDTYADRFGNEGFQQAENYQFFINTQGNLCSISGYCGSMSIPSGIRPVITMDADDFELNTYFDINGTIRWVDNNNSSNTRPTISTIHLYRNGVEIGSVEVTKDDDEDLWQFGFADLPKYDENGDEYVYTVSQDDIPLYSSDITDFNIVNRYSDSEIPESPDTIDNIVLYSGIGIFMAAITTVGFLAIRTRR